MSFAPMLAARERPDLSQLRYPVLVSPKLDGIRCIIRDGIAYSRKLKPIPNAFVQGQLARLPTGLDGELIVGSPSASDAMRATSSGVMSRGEEPDFSFHVFDFHPHARPFSERLRDAELLLRVNDHPRTLLVGHQCARDAQELMSFEESFVAAGYEGLMIRDPNGPYKHGRSTVKDGYLLKLKRFDDLEAEIIGYVPLFRNGNEAKTNALGHTERSSAKANKTATEALGAHVCRLPNGIEFEVGTGWTEPQRAQLWEARENDVGRYLTVKHQAFTPDGKPRFPVARGFRDPIDI